MCSRKATLSVVFLVAIIAAACYFDVYSFTQYSCLECRATLTKRRICGISFQRVAQDPYSTAVLTRNPSHQHQWCWCGSQRSYSLVTVTYSCGHQHPIWELSVSVQAQYSRLAPASELQEALRAIDSPDRKTAEVAVNQVYERVLDSR